MLKVLRRQDGDTIIEVMVAFAVFAMVAVGAITIMNQGTAGSQNTLETTLVRQQVDNQAEFIRYLHQAYISNPDDTTPGSPSVKFKDILAFAKAAALTQPSPFGTTCTQTLPGTSATRFVLNNSGVRISNVRPASAIGSAVAPYAQLADTTTSYGLWTEPIISEPDATGTTRYIDFHVRACWESASASPQRTLGTIVRLYVPDNVATGSAGAGGSTIPTPAIPAQFTQDGSARLRCFDLNALEGQDTDGYYPGQPPFTWNNSTVCGPAGAGAYSCSNYDSEFGSLVPNNAAGNYALIIQYYDFNCGNATPLPTGYNFKVAVYKDGAFVGTYDLPSNRTTSNPITIPGQVNNSTRIQIRWWNNHFTGTPSADPDLVIQQIIMDSLDR